MSRPTQPIGGPAKGSATRRRSESRHAFGFLDETGTLGGDRDPFFAVGLLRCETPWELQRAIQRLRDRTHFYDEIKWSRVSGKKKPVLETIVDVFVGSGATFSAFVASKEAYDVIGRFGGPFKAYEALARQLVHGTVRRGETMWIIADEYSSPAEVRFEENVRDHVNNRSRGGDPVAGVCRMRSSGVDLLQLADLLLGAVVFEHKMKEGLTSNRAKVHLLAHLKTQTGVATFVGGHRDQRFNVAEYRLSAGGNSGNSKESRP